MKQKILVVDDSPFIRRILSDWVKAEGDMELVGVATNGAEAVQMARSLKPDLITLDVEMPVMDGLAALQEIMAHTPTRVLMVSSVTTQGAQATMKALQLGAYDFVTKPNGSSSLKVVQAKTEVLAKIRAGKEVKLVGHHPVVTAPLKLAPKTTDKIVVIACSTGGPKALHSVWETLPKGFPAPILIVQHMPAGFTDSFAKRLDGIGTVPCKEAAEGDRILPGMGIVAPGGKHMIVGKAGHVTLNEDPMLHGTRPAADPLFKTVVQHYGSKVIGVVLTGMGRDGAEGCKAIVDAGGVVLGQDEPTSTVYGMPRAAKEIGGVTLELPIHAIGAHLVDALEGRLKRAS